MNPYKVRYQLTEGKHYHDCQDVITHPLVVEAFRFGDFEGSYYDSIEWEGSVYEASYVQFPSGGGEVFVGEWYLDTGDDGL